MYSFGATLSFTVAHASIVALRYRSPSEELTYRAKPNLRFRGVDWPLFAIVGGIGTALAWTVIVVQEEVTRWAGLGWLALGFVGYAVYRRFTLHAPMTETVRAPVLVLGPSLTVEYRTIVVPVVRTAESEEALVAAARLAADRGSTVAVVHVIEVPLDLPLDVRLPQAEDEADELLDSSAALLESYGVRAVVRLLRARTAGPEIVTEAGRRNAELVILGAPRPRHGRRGRIFGTTVDYVLKHSPSRVLIAAGRRAA
jgi:APA family basic amino acid/polyamine antiporter